MRALTILLVVLGTLTMSAQSGHNVVLTWNESGQWTFFRVYRKLPTENTFAQHAGGIKTLTWTDPNVAAGTWDYEVRAVLVTNGVTTVSNPSNVVIVKVP